MGVVIKDRAQKITGKTTQGHQSGQTSSQTDRGRKKARGTKIRNGGGSKSQPYSDRKSCRTDSPPTGQQLCSNKLDNVKETEKSLQTLKSPKLTQEGTKNFNKLLTAKSESLIRNLPIKKILRQDGFMGEFYQTFWKRTTLTLLNSPRNWREGNSS